MVDNVQTPTPEGANSQDIMKIVQEALNKDGSGEFHRAMFTQLFGENIHKYRVASKQKMEYALSQIRQFPSRTTIGNQVGIAMEEFFHYTEADIAIALLERKKEIGRSIETHGEIIKGGLEDKIQRAKQEIIQQTDTKITNFAQLIGSIIEQFSGSPELRTHVKEEFKLNILDKLKGIVPEKERDMVSKGFSTFMDSYHRGRKEGENYLDYGIRRVKGKVIKYSAIAACVIGLIWGAGIFSNYLFISTRSSDALANDAKKSSKQAIEYSEKAYNASTSALCTVSNLDVKITTELSYLHDSLAKFEKSSSDFLEYKKNIDKRLKSASDEISQNKDNVASLQTGLSNILNSYTTLYNAQQYFIGELASFQRQLKDALASDGSNAANITSIQKTLAGAQQKLQEMQRQNAQTLDSYKALEKMIESLETMPRYPNDGINTNKRTPTNSVITNSVEQPSAGSNSPLEYIKKLFK